MRSPYFLALFGVLALGCGSSSSASQPTSDAGADVQPDAVVVKPEGSANVTLLTLTAWQGQLEPLTVTTDKTQTALGGFPVLSAYFKEERAATKDDVLVVAAGDEFGATPVLSSVFEDEPAIKALDFLGVRASTFGNHNFDHGIPRLRALIESASYTFVTSNLTNVATELGAKVKVPYYMVEVGATDPKPKIAFIGLSSPSLLSIQFPGKFGSIGIEEPVAAAQKAVKAARDAGASAVVALTHEGADRVDAGVPSGPIVELAKAVSGVDVWVADHTDLKVSAMVNGALVVQNKKRGQGYAVVRMEIKDGQVVARSGVLKDAVGSIQEVFPAGAACTAPAECASGVCTEGKCVVSCPSTPCSDASFTCESGVCRKVVKEPDLEADAVLEPYRKALPEKFDVKVAVIDREYKRGGSPHIERIGETPLGDLVADAMLKRYQPLGAQIAITNGGGIRNPLPSPYAPLDKTLRRTAVGYAPGPPYDLVVGDMYSMHPYGNAAIVRKVKGTVLWAALEHGLGFLPVANGAFPQIAGFKVVYDPAAPKGSRVISVTLDDGTAIARTDTKDLGLVTVDFINFGGDGYSMLVEAVPSQPLDLLTTIVGDYLKSVSPVPAPVGGRLIPKM